MAGCRPTASTGGRRTHGPAVRAERAPPDRGHGRARTSHPGARDVPWKPGRQGARSERPGTSSAPRRAGLERPTVGGPSRGAPRWGMRGLSPRGVRQGRMRARDLEAREHREGCAVAGAGLRDRAPDRMAVSLGARSERSGGDGVTGRQVRAPEGGRPHVFLDLLVEHRGRESDRARRRPAVASWRHAASRTCRSAPWRPWDATIGRRGWPRPRMARCPAGNPCRRFVSASPRARATSRLPGGSA